MVSWNDFAGEAPELAAAVLARFEAHGLGYLATIRADGSPRICGQEPLVSGGDLWLGMMPDSRKSLDLQRDPRFALHSANADKDVADGDAKVAGAVVAATSDADIAAFRAAFAAHAGYEPPPGPMDLYRAELVEASFLRPNGDHLLIDIWRAGDGVRQVKRS